VPGRYLEPVRESLARYAGVGESLKEICAINLELLRRREPFEKDP